MSSQSIPSRLLLVFVKEPLPGKVKTRMGATVGHEEAAKRYKALVAVLLRQLRGVEDCRVRICYAPDDADEAVRFWILPQLNEVEAVDDYFRWSDVVGGMDFRAQGEGDLGVRLERAYEMGFADGYSQVAAIGSDCVEIGAGWINTAFARLNGEARQIAVGPSPDGGYCFLGMSQHTPELFWEIPWSCESTLSATLEVAKLAGLKYDILPELSDIDSESDWDELMEGPQGGAMQKIMEIL